MASKKNGVSAGIVSLAVIAGGALAVAGGKIFETIRLRLSEHGRYVFSGFDAAKKTDCSRSVPADEVRVEVAFFDWDGVFLGARSVPCGGRLKGDHLSLEECGDGADCAPRPLEGEILFDTVGDGKYHFFATGDPGNGVANKRGYDFAGWVPFTGCSVPRVAYNAARGQKIPEEELVALSNIQADMVLKAAYNENRDLLGANSGTRFYQLSCSLKRHQDGKAELNIIVRRPENARRIPEGEKILKVSVGSEHKDRREPLSLMIPVGDRDVETVTINLESEAVLRSPSTMIRLSIVDGDLVPHSAVIHADTH